MSSTDLGIEPSTLNVCLRSRAVGSPDAPVFTFLEDGGRRVETLSYGELDRRARAIAAAIRGRASKGHRVLLLFAPGLDFIAALYGCFYAGATAVPAYPPDPARIDRTLPRLRAIVRDADPSLVLTTAPILEMAKHVFTMVPEVAALEWLAADQITARGDSSDHQEPGLGGEDLAIVQYTSGSTSVPKGVMVSHRNILVNMRMIQKAAGHDSAHVISSWLPHGHDLGLMGGIFLPVIIGCRAVLMSPLEFLRRPITWLSSITQYRATDTFLPNFALDLCVRKTTSAERKTLDLSSIQMCVVAAEPVRHSTVQRFLRTFEKHGFPRRGMIPGYGLAEAVVAVTGGPYGSLQSAFVDSTQLAQNRFVEVGQGHASAVPIVACGQPFEGVHIEIVNTETSTRAEPGEIGEIWLAGPSIAMGYWRQEDQTRETFGARIAGDEERRYLRTGDLGCRREGFLYITGRIKDLIIIRGKNYYPQDIELTVERCHTRTRPGAVIAFSVEHTGVERIVIVAELDPRELRTDDERREAYNEIISAIRVAVNAEHGLQVHSVALIKAKSIDKTSSGKLARRGCRNRYLEKTLDAEIIWTLSDLSVDEAPTSSGPISGDDPISGRRPLLIALRQAPPVERFGMLTDYLARQITRLAGDGASLELTEDTLLQEIGLDSLSAMDLAGRIEKDLGVKLPVVKLLDSTSIGDLVEQLLDSMDTDVVPSSRSLQPAAIPPPPPSQPIGAIRVTPQRLADLTPPPRSVRPSSMTPPPPSSTRPPTLRNLRPSSITPPPPSSGSIPPPSRKTLPALTDTAPSSIPPPSVRFLRQTLPPGSVRPAFTQAVALRGFVSQAPIFCVGGLAGTVPYLMSLANELGPGVPFIAFQATGVDGSESPMQSVEEMARRFLDEMKAIQPVGPYVFAGHSFGGLVVYEMAQRLVEKGEVVSHVFLLDSSTAKGSGPLAEAEDVMAMFELVNIFRRIGGQPQEALHHSEIAALSTEEQRAMLAGQLGPGPQLAPGSTAANVVDVYMASFTAMEQYRPVPYPGPVTLLRADKGLPSEVMHPARSVRMSFDDPTLGWGPLCPALRVVTVPGDHFSMILPPNVRDLSDAMKGSLAEDARMELGMERVLPAKGSARAQGRPIEVTKRGVTFNPFHAAFFENPYPMLHQLRTHDPVHWSSMSCWWITRYSDVAAGLRDKRFSVDSRNWVGRTDKEIDVQAESAKPSILTSWFRKQTDLPLAQLYNSLVMFLDPPHHQRLRRLFAPSFEPAVIRRWKEYTDERVEDLIAEMRHLREPDMVRDLALPLPISVISEMLGVPHDDASFLRRWSYDLTQAFDPFVSNDVAMRANKVAGDFMRYIREHVERKRKSPGTDLLDLLIKVESEGDRLSTDELVANCVLLFTAGFETTSSVIGNSTLALLRNPDQLDLLRKRPELTENAVEELLRYEGAGRVVFRTALDDIEISGKVIRRGDSVLFVLPGANRDPAAFPDPDRLDLTRNAKNHVAFGHGGHYCLGAPLARLEIQSVIAAIARHDISLVPGGFDWRQSLCFRGLDRLRVTFAT